MVETGTGDREGVKPPDWAALTDEALLGLRMCDLGLSIEGTDLEPRIAQLNAELVGRGLKVRLRYWLSDEWFTPDGVPGIAIPFYLAHPRLQKLELAQMLEVEGGDPVSCLRILRHEAGHAIDNAYALRRRPTRRRLFGNPETPYPEYYTPKPYSKSFVHHLDHWYAQSHPDEDFAETFAVWLQGPGFWRRRYRGWPAMKKLAYVDDLMKELRGATPLVYTRRTVEPLRELRITLDEYYREKKRNYTTDHPDIYDRDLRRLFSADPKKRDSELASSFLRRNRAEIRQLVARWTGEYQFTLDQVLSDIIGRCRELRLRVTGAERRLRVDFAVLLTVQTMHFLYNKRNWIAL